MKPDHSRAFRGTPLGGWGWLSWALGCAGLLAIGCQDPPLPRPKGYFRLEVPEATFVPKTTPCPLQFEAPTDSRVESAAVPPTSPSPEEGQNCWFNLAYPQWKARLHCTYIPLRGDLETRLQEAHDMTFGHEIKSSGIAKRRFDFPEHRVHGLVYELDGPVATPLQFFATDSLNHFLRAALYFEHAPNPDSIAPAYNRIAQDVIHLIETLEWTP